MSSLGRYAGIVTLARARLLPAVALLAVACVHRPPEPEPVPPVRVTMPPPATTMPVVATVEAVGGSAALFARLDRMDWPGPNRYRSADGQPGPDYWQQRADYEITATLDTAQQRVSGHVVIHYTNNSPDSLGFVWLQLDQNLYRPGSKGSALFPASSRWGVRGFEGGYDLAGVTVNGTPATPHVDDTMMRLDLAAPLAPHGGTATIAMDFAFRVPEHGSDRMGRDGPLYEIAQWYPRMAVYDDVRGWNPDPYLGQGEFYLEYGDIDYTVTVPAGYTVAGSGVLQNAADVLTAAEQARLAAARQADSVVAVIPESEARATPTPGTKSWHFHADHVRDVAWAGAPDFRWDATSWQGVLMQAYYEWPKAGPAWEHAAADNQFTIRTYSTLFYRYPYPQATAVAGPVAGMEYPMFVMDGYSDPSDQGELFRTNDHELGHQWFPMVVGSNERRYAWMDEGINTYINAFSQERKYGSDVSSWPRGMDNPRSWTAAWRSTAASGTDVPLMTMPDDIDPRALGTEGYRKPGEVLMLLRDVVVGPETFDRAFRAYIGRWAFKHPTPGDFFRTIENVSGEDLAWFWRAFLYDTATVDIGVERATTSVDSGQRTAHIWLHRVGGAPFPVVMRLALANGSTQDVTLPVRIWVAGPEYEATIPVASDVVGVRLWPDPIVPDWNHDNDAWGRAPAADPLAPSTGGGLSGTIPSAPAR